ncbi:hypothetical protein LRS06_21355, partial [Hymenobacter sp. J193]|uniref:hypothetical protein n=1 Tax=Hymenobacter sp. J193 TaxID=2898429 RepID=UPI0021515D2C
PRPCTGQRLQRRGADHPRKIVPAPGFSVSLQRGHAQLPGRAAALRPRLSQRWALADGQLRHGPGGIAATYDLLTAAYAPGNNAQGSGLATTR